MKTGMGGRERIEMKIKMLLWTRVLNICMELLFQTEAGLEVKNK